MLAAEFMALPLDLSNDSLGLAIGCRGGQECRPSAKLAAGTPPPHPKNKHTTTTTTTPPLSVTRDTALTSENRGGSRKPGKALSSAMLHLQRLTIPVRELWGALCPGAVGWELPELPGADLAVSALICC